jgi:hypothetical protein
MAKLTANDTDKGNTLPKVVEPKNEQKTTKETKRNKIENTKGKGVKFDSKNQPQPEAKKMGWQRLREQRLLTQNILKMYMDDNGLPTKEGKDLFKSLHENAKNGNAKALDIISKAIEDDVQKVAITDGEGNALPAVVIKAIK